MQYRSAGLGFQLPRSSRFKSPPTYNYKQPDKTNTHKIIRNKVTIAFYCNLYL